MSFNAAFADTFMKCKNSHVSYATVFINFRQFKSLEDIAAFTYVYDAWINL